MSAVLSTLSLVCKDASIDKALSSLFTCEADLTAQRSTFWVLHSTLRPAHVVIAGRNLFVGYCWRRLPGATPQFESSLLRRSWGTPASADGPGSFGQHKGPSTRNELILRRCPLDQIVCRVWQFVTFEDRDRKLLEQEDISSCCTQQDLIALLTTCGKD